MFPRQCFRFGWFLTLAPPLEASYTTRRGWPFRSLDALTPCIVRRSVPRQRPLRKCFVSWHTGLGYIETSAIIRLGFGPAALVPLEGSSVS